MRKKRQRLRFTLYALRVNGLFDDLETFILLLRYKFYSPCFSPKSVYDLAMVSAETHLLKFHKAVFYMPDLVRAKPLVTDEDRQLAAQDPPYPVPFHCKPWVDGSTAGWTLFYGFLTPLTIVGLADGQVRIDGIDQLQAETRAIQQAHVFAKGLFSLSTGYKLHTSPGMVTLLISPSQPPAGYEPLTAVVETDWFPKDIFLAVKAPAEGETIELEYKSELARAIVVPRQDTTQAVAMDDAEVEAIMASEAEYLEAQRTTPTRWRAATGDEFTHLYKQRSREYRRRLKQLKIED